MGKKLEKNISQRGGGGGGGGCLIMAMSTDAFWGGHFSVEPGIFLSNRAFFCRTMHFAVEPGFFLSDECYNLFINHILFFRLPAVGINLWNISYTSMPSAQVSEVHSWTYMILGYKCLFLVQCIYFWHGIHKNTRNVLKITLRLKFCKHFVCVSQFWKTNAYWNSHSIWRAHCGFLATF